MKVTLVPVLQSLRSVYDVEGVMPRFGAYTSLMTCNPKDVLPLGAFSPMGKTQPRYLDTLLDLEAESIAQEAAAEAASRLSSVSDSYRLVLVVVDAPEDKNTWTDRYLTDAEWRFESKYDTTTRAAGEEQSVGSWLTVQLWTDTPATTTYVTQETQAAIYRAAHRRHVGVPETLGEMMAQEGRAQRFAGCKCRLPLDDPTVATLDRYRESTHYPTCFAAMYGDVGASRAGYPELGLDPLAGFRLGLIEASRENTDVIQPLARTERSQ